MIPLPGTTFMFPDFIIDEKTIVEVKSSLDREKHLGRLECVLRKANAASAFCKLN